MSVGSRSDMSDAVPGSWFCPSPALPWSAPWYTDMPSMPYGRVVLRVRLSFPSVAVRPLRPLHASTMLHSMRIGQ
jgi:hypothetical protein